MLSRNSPDELLLSLNVLERPVGRSGILVSGDEKWWIVTIVLVKILQGSIRSFWVQKVDDGKEEGVEDCKYNPKLPT